MYANSPVAKSDKWPPTPSTVYIKLALVKKEKVSRTEADKFTYLTFRGDIDTILQAKEQIEMDDILKEEDKTRLVVVEGAPGIGKSTFAWELCRQWPTLESLKRFSLVVLLRLREEGVQTATHITDLFPCGDDPDLSRLVAEEVRRENGKGVLFVFDGFDEFPAELCTKSLVTDIISGSAYLPRATVLVTSRPSATAQLQSLFQTGIGKRIEIVGFSHKEIHEYAESVLGSGSEMLVSFKTYLSANPVVKAMMYNPLNSAIVVKVYQEASESGKPIPHTQTQLYTELTLYLLSRHLSDHLARRLPDRLEDIPRDSDLYQQLKELGKLAFEGIVRNEIIFKELPEGCSDLGLLVEHRALYTRKETKTYNFFHLTLQEYLGAFYISQLPANEQRTLFIEHAKSEHLRVVWRFVAGLTRMQHIGWDKFNKIWRQMEDDEESIGYVVLGDTVSVWSFIVECLYEAQDVQSCECVFGQSKVEYLCRFETPYAVYAVGYCVSVCSNTCNVNLSNSECGSETLEMLVHGLKSVEFGGGSIEKLDLSTCSGVMEGGRLVQLPHQILQHIRSLNLVNCSLIKETLDILADSIPRLHSLTSLNISYNEGVVGSTVKLLRALRQHGKLETLYMRAIVIGMDDVAALSDLIQSPGNLRELTVSNFPKSIHHLAIDGQSLLAPEVHVFQQLMRTVLSPSSLKILHITYFSTFHLDDIGTISGNLSTLALFSVSSLLQSPSSSSAQSVSMNTPEQPTVNLGVKGGTKLSRILRENTSLRELYLSIPLDRDEVHDIVHSLEDNHSLVKLVLSEKHSQYFSESERQALDPRINFYFLFCTIFFDACSLK